MTAAYAYAIKRHPVATGQDGTIYHRFNFPANSYEVLTLDGWQHEDSADYGRQIPITKIPVCDPVMPINNTNSRPSFAAAAANAEVFEELKQYKINHSTPTTTSTFKAEAMPVETLAQQSARLDKFVEQHNEAAKRRHTKTENFLLTHMAPVGPWVAHKLFGNDDAPKAGNE